MAAKYDRYRVDLDVKNIIDENKNKTQLLFWLDEAAAVGQQA
jgi:hypothetical protein